jgi:hypothetical protein
MLFSNWDHSIHLNKGGYMRDDLSRVVRKYEAWIKHSHCIPDRVLLLALFVFLISAFLLRQNIWLFWLCMYAVVRTWGDIAQREGHRDGYISGHQYGYEDGKLDALGVDEGHDDIYDLTESEQFISTLEDGGSRLF